MKKSLMILSFCSMIFFTSNNVSATQNGTIPQGLSGQSCGISDNRLCNAIANDLMKELIKQTVYTVGTQVLNKYVNPAATPAPVYTPPASVYTPPAQTVAPYTAPVYVPPTNTTSITTTNTSTNTGQSEPMIFIQ